MIHQSHSWEYIWRKSQLEKIHAPQCSLQHYLQKLGRGKWKWSCSVMSNSATPWTVAYQASPSMGFSRQEHRSGLPFPSLGILLTQGSNLSLPHAGRCFTLYATREASGHGSKLHVHCQIRWRCGTHIQWNITEPQRRMKQSHLQWHGWA